MFSARPSRFYCGLLAALIALPFCVPAEIAATAEFVLEWGEQGSAPGQFDIPIDIAINAADEIFVTDHYNDRVQKFDVDGKFLARFSLAPNPGGIAIAANGDLYITHFAAAARSQNKPGADDCITVHAPDGQVKLRWGKKGKGDGEFDCPGGIALSSDGRVYVADQTNHRVQVFDRSGKFLFKWGEYGNATGQFGGGDAVYSRTGGPQFITLDNEGDVWTTESMGCRVQVYTHDGEFIRAWGTDENKPGAFGGKFMGFKSGPARLQGPVSLRFAKDDTLWVTAISGRIQQFTKEGACLGGVFNGQGDGPGQFYAPHGLALDSKGSLYVVDSFNHRIQKFAPNAPAPAP